MNRNHNSFSPAGFCIYVMTALDAGKRPSLALDGTGQLFS